MKINRKYKPQIISPYYSDGTQGSGPVLHRFLDDQFMPRFLDKAHSNKLGTDSQRWFNDDRFVDKRYPTLRLPIHRTFYTLCCEACCDAPGRPALEHGRVESAGFVIRKVANDGKEHRWLVSEGVDIGWGSAYDNCAEEPDHNLFAVHKGIAAARFPEPAYTGERTYPMIAMNVVNDAASPAREHTLLYGFLPLSGQSLPATESNTTDLETFKFPTSDMIAQEVTWPLGNYLPDGQTAEWKEDEEAHSGYLIQDGEIAAPLGEMFAILIERFHLFTEYNSDNDEIINLLKEITVYSGSCALPLLEECEVEVESNLYTFMSDNIETVESWLALFNREMRDAAKASESHRFASDVQLFVSEAQASALKSALLERSRGLFEVMLSDMPMPRYERNGVYVARSFMRYRNAKGGVKVVWGDASARFQVATPFNPKASRPHLIQLPDWSDIKNGVASGAAMRVPKSLSGALESLNPSLGDDAGKRHYQSRGEWDWVYVFSIPIVTFCAMIILMILVNLLNFIFRWIPWFIMRIPVPK